jgi:hypothetical protein
LTLLWHAERYHDTAVTCHAETLLQSSVIDTAVTGSAVSLTPLCNQLC